MFSKNLIIGFCFLAYSTLAYAQTDIFAAARTGNVKAAQKMISINPDTINSANDQGYTPLILASYYGHAAFIKFILDNGAVISDAPGTSTALQACCYKGYTEASKLLLQKGADPNICDSNGSSPLIYATQAGHKEIVKMLLQYKANKSHKDGQGFTARDYAKNLQHNEILAMLE